jgi:hypothetical protein
VRLLHICSTEVVKREKELQTALASRLEGDVDRTSAIYRPVEADNVENQGVDMGLLREANLAFPCPLGISGRVSTIDLGVSWPST